MINLATKDISHSFSKFVVTAMGVGMLLGVVLLMIGVYRGMVYEAEVLLNDINIDLWIVQDNTLGPFAESSRVHEDLKNTIMAIDGVEKTSAITFQNIQLPQKNGEKLRVFAVGYNPFDNISPLNQDRLIEGRGILKSNYELVVGVKANLKLNEIVTLGKNSFRVVGITKGVVSSSGDPIVYMSLKDAQELQFLYSNPRIRNDRKRGILNNDSHMVNAIIATTKKGYDKNLIAQEIKRYKYKSVYTDEQQSEILVTNLVKRASKQIGLFTAILVVVATIIIALIIYTMTLEKMKEIAIMKLIGLPNIMIVKMIVQETLILGIFAFIFGNIFAHLVYENFPKKVVLITSDAWVLFGVVVLASVLSSFAGVKKVVSADPREAIGG